MKRTVLSCLCVFMSCAMTASFAADVPPVKQQENRSAVERTLEKAAPPKPGPDKNKPAASALQLPDISQCKEQAHGLEGPGRARFMTECLKRN